MTTSRNCRTRRPQSPRPPPQLRLTLAVAPKPHKPEPDPNGGRGCAVISLGVRPALATRAGTASGRAPSRGGADELSGDERQYGGGRDTGEGVAEHAADRDRGVGEARGRREEVRGADVRADRRCRQVGAAGAASAKMTSDEPGSRDDFCKEQRPPGSVSGAPRDGGSGEHHIREDRAGDASEDLRGQIDRRGGPGRRCSTMSTRVTTGLKWDPDTVTKTRISTARPSAVANAFSKSCRPTSVGDSRCAAMPEPTTTAARPALPRNSAGGGA